MRQQQAMQQQAMQQRAMQQQAMQQQAMQQQAMQQQAMQQQMLQQQGTENFKGNDTFFSKIKNLNMNKTLQEIFLIAILFIIFSTAFFKTNLGKILPFVSVENDCLNTGGLLISAVLISLLFIIIRLFL